MRKFKMTGREVIGYIRVMRPGSILGPQQVRARVCACVCLCVCARARACEIRQRRAWRQRGGVRVVVDGDDFDEGHSD